MAKYRRFINYKKTLFDNKELPIFEEYDPYIHFSDPKVKKIAEETYGDETGKVKAKVWHNINGFTGNFKSSDIEYFPELATMGINYPNAALNFAFENCKNLKYIIINRRLGTCICIDDSSLEYVILENTNKTDLIDISSGAFRNCTKLKKIKLLDSIINLTAYSTNWGAFENTGVVSINKKDDRNTFDLNNVTSLGFGCFRYCKNLEYADISKIEELGNNAFDNDPLLKTVILNPNLTKLGNEVFKACRLLEMDSLPEGITYIGNNCFYNCNNITLSKLPEGITIIGSNCFYFCKNITLSKLPEDITFIGSGCFQGCTNITLSELPEGITSLGGSCFRDCKNITLLELPEGITSLENDTFNGCTNLALTKLPEGITSIGNNCFYNCTNITLTELPEGITSIGNGCFNNCNLILKTLPESLEFIGNGAFRHHNENHTIILAEELNLPNLIDISSTSLDTIFTGQGTGPSTYINNCLPNLKKLYCPKLSKTNYRYAYGHGILGNSSRNNIITAPLLEEVYMPLVTKLGSRFLSNCPSLKRYNSDIDGVADLTNITNIGYDGNNSSDGCAFQNTNLIKFILPDNPPLLEAISDNNNINNFPSDSKFYVSSDEVKQAYLNDEKWSLFDSDRFVIGTMETIRQEMETL